MTFDPTRAVYGPELAPAFFRAVENGTDCLDVVMIGDSNTGFSQYGWHEGLAKAFISVEGLPMYATPLAPLVARSGASSGNIGYLTNYDHAQMRASTEVTDPAVAYSVSQANLTTYGGMYDGFIRGNTDSNCATLRAKFNIGVCSGDNPDTSGDYLSNNAYWGFGFSDSTGSTNPFFYSHTTGGISLQATSPFVGSVFTYRVIHSYGSGGGSFTMSVRQDVSPFTDITTAKAVSTDNGQAWGWGSSELEADTTGQSVALRASCFGLSNATRTVNGNVGFLFHSCYRKVKGIAFNNLMYMGGRDSNRLYSVLAGTSDAALVTYVTELVNRQKAAGGTGRLLFFIQAGTNDVGASTQTTAQNFLENIRGMIDRLLRIMSLAGIPGGQFAFVVMVSHPETATDVDNVISGNSMTIYREIIAQQSNPRAFDLQCTFVNLLALKSTYATTYNRLFDQGLYASTNTDPNHLLTAGYDELGAPIADALLTYTTPPSPHKIALADGRIADWHRFDVKGSAVVKDRSIMLSLANDQAGAEAQLVDIWNKLGGPGSPPQATYFTREDLANA